MSPTRPASGVERFDVLAPAGTAKASPVEVATGFSPAELVGLRIEIPDGHAGLTGIRVALAHAPVIPRTSGAWISGNDQTIELDTVGYPNSGAWSCFVYNLDGFDHTFHVTFYVADFPYVADQTQPVLAATPLVT